MVKSMKIYKNFIIQPQHKNSVILVGNFDGIHLGHQKLFSLAKKYKKKYSLKVGVLTFEPIPKFWWFWRSISAITPYCMLFPLGYFQPIRLDQF